MKKRLFLIAAGLGLLVFYSCAVRVRGQGTAAAGNGYSRQCEKEYLQEVTEVLEEDGITDAGVAMTYVREADGSRAYRLVVHHRRINRMQDSEKELLRQRLAGISFTVPDSTVRQEFLEA